MKALVAGGAGYIGSQVTFDLIRAGHEVVVVDNLSTGLREFVHSRATFYEADITDACGLAAVFTAEPDIDVVVHFAAKLIVSESITAPLAYYHNNVEGVRVMLATMLDAGIHRLVFSSTAAVYGNPCTEGALTEDSPCVPITPYGATKLAAEDLIRYTAAAQGLDYAILRYFNAAGADESLQIGLEKSRYTHLVPLATRAALGLSESLHVYGDDWPTPDGSCIRDYIHVEDLSDAHLRAADYLLGNKGSLLLNLGTGKGSSVKEVIAAVDALRPVPFVLSPRRAGDPAILVANATRAHKLLGWRPKHDLNAIVTSDFNYRLKQIAVL